MTRDKIYLACGVLLGFLILGAGLLAFRAAVSLLDPDQSRASGRYISNQSVIDGLREDLEPNDPLTVFRRVFRELDDEVKVYPSENYYYYQMFIGGMKLKGSITLFTKDRDLGVVGFDYMEITDRENFPGESLRGGGGEFTQEDSVFIRKLSDFQYVVSLDGKTVVFNLHQTGTLPPRKARLKANEVFVGRTFDESGLQFFLVFNKAISRLYWILNEDSPVLESFAQRSQHVVIGRRTGFAFYVDRANNRKALVGVYGMNVMRNNWYDGPFDQMPDNYVYTGEVEIQRYLEANFPSAQGKIDKYGHFLEREGSRLAAANYRVYFKAEELDYLDELVAAKISEEDLYREVTRPVFEVPSEYAAYFE